MSDFKTNAPYHILIVGAGRIGSMFDKPGASRILTHAHAFTTHPRFVLKGIVDPDFERSQEAATRWNCRPFRMIEEAFAEMIDIAVVASPDETHYCLLKELAQRPLRLVIAEKPLTQTLEQATEIVELYKHKNIPVAVNYTRRFAKGVVSLQKDIRERKFGKLLRGVGYYGKGILHNGSHMIDLLDFFFGNVQTKEVFETINDFYENDPTVSCRLILGNDNAGFTLFGMDCRNYTIFEMELFFEKARIRMVESGDRFEIYHVIDSPVFQGYRVLDHCNTFDSGNAESFYQLAETVANCLDYGNPLPSTAETALVSQSVCTQLL